MTYGAISESNQNPPLLRVTGSDGFAEPEGDQPIANQLRVETTLRRVITSTADLPRVFGGQGRDDYDESICVNVFPDGNPDFNQTFSDCWTFEVDTLAPTAPRVTNLVPGEDRVEVQWEAITDNNIEFVEIVYCVNASTLTVSFAELPCSESERRFSGTISDTQTSASISDGIRTGERVVVAMRAIDEFDNVGEVGNVDDIIPTAVDDFFEIYTGNEDGGFCFIATAAYGSYAHPMVQVLRTFRDRVLNATPLGAAFVWAYYTYAPPLAEAVAADPELAAWVRVWLVPLVAVALLIMCCPLLAAGWVLRRGWLWIRRWDAAKVMVAVGVAASALIWSTAAEARRPESDLSFVGVGIEFKGGPYRGAIQDEEGFQEVFDSDGTPIFTLGVDLQVYRGFGTVTAGGSIGFATYSGRGLFAKDRQPSTDDNDLFMVPFTATIGYRFDWLADRTWIPLVPYARGGLAYFIWWATNGVDNLQRRNIDDDRQTARGGKLGYTGTLGVAFLLNKLEPRVAQSLFANTGIRGTYIFFEGTAYEVDGFGGDGFDFSDLNWNIGLYMEL